MDVAIVDQLQERLDAGLTDLERQGIIRSLVGNIAIATIVNDDGTKEAKANIRYRFPAVVATRTARGSWRR
jgi:hypothetical protein